MHDVMTVAWKELKEFLGGQGGRRSGPMRIVFLVLIGVLFAARTSTFGSSWKTVVIIAYMANVVALSLVPDSFAGERERHTLETLLASRLSDRSILFGKYVAVVLYSVLTAAAVLVLGLITSAVTSRGAGVHVRPEVIASSVGAHTVDPLEDTEAGDRDALARGVAAGGGADDRAGCADLAALGDGEAGAAVPLLRLPHRRLRPTPRLAGAAAGDAPLDRALVRA